MTKDEQKRAVARAARDVVATLPLGAILGVGTGTTTACFIDELPAIAARLGGAVASSEATAAHLRALGIRVVDLNEVDVLPLYVDGADEITDDLVMLKGGGGALTREKIVAAVARDFVCICDESKRVRTLGAQPLPVEVVPMARAYVARELARLGGDPRPRAGFITDNGNVILDVHGLTVDDPLALEARIEQTTGVVACGLFARRRADVLLVATADGVARIALPATGR